MQLNIAELSWEEVKQYIYPSDGSLPDIYVLNTTYDDWRRWAAWVNATYPVRFRDTNQQEHASIDTEAVLSYWQGDRLGDMPFASIWVGNVQLNCFFLAEDSLDGDINPQDIQSIEDHQALLKYLANVSRLLGKEIVMLDEGTRSSTTAQFEPAPLLFVIQDQVHTNAYWRST
ncbi:MAG: hypothetical protein EOO61_16305 [Hymenobacter sp.]|nr:MAG: hypothetical protein EOO61_16305 [Hymenobacter sp.]